MERQRSAFARYFSNWGIELPEDDVAQRKRGKLFEAGWSVRWIFGSDERGEYLDFYATHRMTNDRHLRLHENGEEEEYYAHNRRIGRMLRAKGF